MTPADWPPAVLATVAALFGGIVGSFLNVVILRLPRMLEAQWRRDSRDFLGLEPLPAVRFDLSHPGSHCPDCGARIRPWHNIPVLSWLLLRGRAACCGTAISVQYPIVELLGAGAAAVCALRFGWSPALAAALALSWTLLTLAVIDYNTTLLPDTLTQPLLWGGLLLSVVPVFVGPVQSILGAAIGYGSLWTVAWLFRKLRGHEGMAPGDFKLLGALGAWLGWAALPEVILLSSLVGALLGGAAILFRRRDAAHPIPFGPYLAAAGWLALIWGDTLREAYLTAAGLHG